MFRYNNISWYLTIAGIIVVLKFIYTWTGNDQLAFLLTPTDLLFSLMAGSQSVYIPEEGFLHESLNIVIGKSCSGFNFWLLCFCMLNFRVLQFLENPFYKSISIPLTLFAAYLFTVPVNASRIFVSVVMHNRLNSILTDQYTAVLHESIGIFVNLTFLIILYILTEKYLTRKYRNEKPA